MSKLVARLKIFFDESSIHGLKYVTEKGRHWTERLFWICISAVATYTAFSYTQKFISKESSSFVVETAYLGWKTDFPSVSICETDADLGNIETTAEKLFGEDRNPGIDGFLREIAFFDGKCLSCSESCGKTLDCPQNFEYLASMARVPCNELISDCYWNGREFDCCENFMHLGTEIGACFTINSIQTLKESKIQLLTNTTTGPGVLSFSASREIYVFLHSKEDVPFMNTPKELKELTMIGSNLDIIFQMNEVENDPGLKNIPIASRKCRFPSESELLHHKAYGYSSCVTECRLKAQVELCKCTHHFMNTSGQIPMCNLSQMECLTSNDDALRKLKRYDSVGDGLACKCESSCTEPDIQIVTKHFSLSEDESRSRVIVKLQNAPTIRFKRTLTRTRADDFVAIGGVLGLFWGASILSIVEIVYILCIVRNRQVVHLISFQN